MFEQRPDEAGPIDFDEIADHLLEQGLDVSPADAYGIASALRDAAEHFILHETTTTIPDLPHLVGDIYEVIAFCCDGGFHIR